MVFKTLYTLLLTFCMSAACTMVQAQNKNDSIKVDSIHRVLHKTNYKVTKTFSTRQGVHFNPKYKRKTTTPSRDTTYTRSVTRSRTMYSSQKKSVVTQQQSTVYSNSAPKSKANRLMVCPNPAEDIINIKGWNQQEAFLEIFSATGQRMMQFPQWNGEEINISSLPAGYYNIRINKKTYIQFVKL